MEELLAILKETEALYKVADKCPRGQLALILWKLEQASLFEEYYAKDANQYWSTVYAELFEAEYEWLGYYGYSPLDF